MGRIGVYGLGYVGTVTAAALASSGHHVTGVDPNRAKVDAINAGRSPVIELGLDDLVSESVEAGRLVAVTDAADAVASTDLSIICVGTPSLPNGSLDLSHVETVCQQIGQNLAGTEAFHTVVVRSTMLPGSTADVVVPALETASGRRTPDEIGVCFNPEFLREGSSLHDYRNPAFTLIGASDERSAAAVAELYREIDAELVIAPPSVAEMVKYVSNAYHALKVVFANEVGNICAAQGIDSHEVMSIFARDTKLNISAAYLRPGFAYGGSCLPKDLRALTYHGRSLDVPLPVLDAISRSNELQIERAFRMVQDAGSRRIGVLGMSFKAGTDDLRESPTVTLIERLIGRGYEVAVYDRNVSLAALHGANREFIEREIPHIASLMSDDLDALVRSSEVLVIGNAAPEFRHAVEHANGDQVVIDLVRLDSRTSDGRYHGIAW